MMGSVRLEIEWSPIHPDKFITWGTEMFLYEVKKVQPCDLEELKQINLIRLSNTTAAKLLATNSTPRYVKCVDIYPHGEDTVVAVGQANGKIVISTLEPLNLDITDREFTPHHPRQCNSVAWNLIDSNIIAAGFEKYRTDHSLLIWDVFRSPIYYNINESVNETVRPIMEIGVSESVNSLAWINSSSLIVGFNNKSLRIIDRRDSTKIVNSTLTKFVYGVKVNPHNEQLIASHVDNQISVWDTRNFEKPIATVSRMKHVTKISWCPTRQNLLGSIQRDSKDIMLHDLQLTTFSNDEVEPTVLERPIQPCSSNITWFSWHPTVESRLLTISLSANMTDYYVIERITLNWLPSSHLVWTHGRKTLKLVSDKDPIYNSICDISTKMNRRALNDYGLKPVLWQNAELAEDETLKHLWNWLDTTKNLVEDGSVKNTFNNHPGVISVLGLDTFKTRSEWVHVSWSDLSNQSFAKVYRSEEREYALNLCGWRFDKDMAVLNTFLEKLEAEGCYSRAAAIAVFNLKLKLAISILNKGAFKQKATESAVLNIVSMALSGFTDDRNSMWREHCLHSKVKLSDPYLRATFSFLTAENENYDGVLNEVGVAVEDKVAFACMFLSDSKLSEYLCKLNDKLTEDGNLAGMLLTGASADGVKLLQRYLDITGDVQSVSFIAMRTLPPELQADDNVQNWILSYRQLLDTRKLWLQRAHFDIFYYSLNQVEKPTQRVFISCNFCGKSITSYMPGINRARSQFSRLGATSTNMKITSCPSCRKPLPRCGICLVHMGTPSVIGSDSENKMADISSWFTWCQTCRHGGHAEHIESWFQNHPECPITGCTCKCMSLDSSYNCVNNL